MDAEALNIVEQLKSCGVGYRISETDVRRVATWANECQAAGLDRATAVDLACRLYVNRTGGPLVHRSDSIQAAVCASANKITDEEKALAAEIIKFASVRR